MWAGVICAAYSAAISAATVVVKDHVTDTAAWDEDGGGILDHFIDPDPGWSGLAGIAMTGNGQRLSTIGVIWGHASVLGEPNGGDFHELRWRFRFFPDTSSFALTAMYNPAPNPNWEAVFDAPSNPGWTDVIGTFLGFELRYAEVDVSRLNIITTSGETHVVVLVPESRLSVPQTIAAVAMSAGGGTTIGTESDWYERGEYLGAEGPGSLASLGENWSCVASKVTVGQALTIHVSMAGNNTNDGLTWATAKLTAQAGLDAATSGDQVWVAAGTYVENVTLADGVALYGGFAGNEDPATFDLATRDFTAHETILDGNQAGSVVTCPPGATTTTRIDGFTIRNGNAWTGNAYGGGIYCDHSSPSIENNRITGNDAAWGGGICCHGGLPTIARNTVTGNGTYYGGAGVYCWDSSATIRNNMITANASAGHNDAFGRGAGSGIHCVAIWPVLSSPTITSNIISGNRNKLSHSGAIFCDMYVAPTITNNTIADNVDYGIRGEGPLVVKGNMVSRNLCGIMSVEGVIEGNTIYGNALAGIQVEAGSGTVANNVIVGNGHSGGGTSGGVQNLGWSGTISNNTVVANGGDWGGGIYVSYQAGYHIVNNIVALNSSGLRSDADSFLVLRYNCVYGNAAYDYSGLADPTGVDGNISADPLFLRNASAGPDGQWGTADDDYGDLRLQAVSPCIDAGNNADVLAGILADVAGHLRSIDDPSTPDCQWSPGTCGTAPIVDMGAYEFVPVLPSDFDRDGDVDPVDLDVFKACATGPAIPYNPAALPEPEPGCALTPDGNGKIAADFDQDGDVDQSDFGIFQRCFSGSGHVVDAGCAQ